MCGKLFFLVAVGGTIDLGKGGGGLKDTREERERVMGWKETKDGMNSMFAKLAPWSKKERKSGVWSTGKEAAFQSIE